MPEIPLHNASASRGTHERCQSSYGGSSCPDSVCFEIDRQGRPAWKCCPMHLGPSLLVVSDVLWPPQIRLVGQPYRAF